MGYLLRDPLNKRDTHYQLLRETIQKQLTALPHVNEPRPARWNAIRKDLRALAKLKDHINFAEYAEICAKHEVTELASQKVLSGYLHRVGSLLHFADDPSLQDFIILKPQWAVDAVYSVLVDNEITKNHGEFNWQTLQSIWQNYTCDEQGKLLNLMKQDNFEICYALDNKANSFIAPQLLSDTQPDYDWHCKAKTDCLKFRFQYKFMPEGIITRLIVRLNAMIVKEQGIDLVWRKGVVVEKEGCRAQVREEDNRDGLKVIEILVTGNVTERKFLLRRIREEIQDIHQKWFRNIQAEQMIPCDCAYCTDVAQTHPKYFELSVLEKAHERNITTLQCDKDFQSVSVMGLLEGVFEEDELQRSDRIGFDGRENEMANKQKGDVINVTQNFNAETHIAAQAIGKKSKASGKIILNPSDKKAVTDLQESVSALMQHIGNHQADFEIKAEAYNELKEINQHLANLENATPETKNKLQALLGSVKDGTLGAIKLAKEIKDGSEAVTWVAEKAALVAPIVAGLAGGA